jgi:release factor glutamine methyltransferase
MRPTNVQPPEFSAACDRRTALLRMTEAFAAAGIETPGLDARRLLEGVLGLTSAALLAGDGQALGALADRVSDAQRRRLGGEPVSRILGHREFYGRRFGLSPDTLDPRPETETLVEVALARLAADGRRDQPLRVLDLGTGSGCLLVTLLAELPAARGLGTDIAAGALASARANAEVHGVGARAHWKLADGPEPLHGPFDLLLSNPPYIRSGDVDRLGEEVSRHDPRQALDGGADGFDFYRRIATHAPRLLAAEGSVLLEVGAGQAEEVARMLARTLPNRVIASQNDLAGIVRCVAAWG